MLVKVDYQKIALVVYPKKPFAVRTKGVKWVHLKATVGQLEYLLFTVYILDIPELFSTLSERIIK